MRARLSGCWLPLLLSLFFVEGLQVLGDDFSIFFDRSVTSLRLVLSTSCVSAYWPQSICKAHLVATGQLSASADKLDFDA